MSKNLEMNPAKAWRLAFWALFWENYPEIEDLERGKV